jgi:hypothetical protein
MPIQCPELQSKDWARRLVKSGGDPIRAHVEYFREQIESKAQFKESPYKETGGSQPPKQSPFADFIRAKNMMDKYDPTKWKDSDYDLAQKWMEGNREDPAVLAGLPIGRRKRIEKLGREFVDQTPEGRAEVDQFVEQLMTESKKRNPTASGAQTKLGPEGRQEPNTNPDLHDIITSGKATVGEALQVVADNKDSDYNLLAQDLLKTARQEGLDAKIGMQEWGSKDQNLSAYYPDSHNIKIGVSATMHEGNFLHEVIHALTSRKLAKEIGSHALRGRDFIKALDAARANPDTPEPVKDLIDAYRIALKHLDTEKEIIGITRRGESYANRYDKMKNTPDRAYGLTNLDEFMAEAMTNRDFQELLNQLPGTGKRTVWQQIIDAITKILGIPVNRGSLLESVIRSTKQISRMENAEHYSTEPKFSGSSYTADHPLSPFHSQEEQDRTTQELVEQGAPRGLIDFHKWFGTQTDQAYVRQTVLPMQQFARETTWGSDTDPKVNSLNTDRALDTLYALREQGFGPEFSNDFQEWAKGQGHPELTQHKGDVAAGVLHAELAKYARDAVAAGDPKAEELMTEIMRNGTNNVVVNNILSATTAGRLLQLHSMASKEMGFWQGMQKIEEAKDEAIDKTFGGVKVAQIEKATEAPTVEDIGEATEGPDVDKAAQELSNIVKQQDEEMEKFDKEAERMIDSMASRFSDTPENKQRIVSQLKELTDRYTEQPFNEFKDQIMSLGVSEEHADQLQALLNEGRRRNKAVSDAKRIQKLREAPQKAAERIVDKIDESQTETRLPEPVKSKVKDLAKAALEDERTDNARPGFLPRDRFIKSYSEAFQELGVDDTTSYALASRLYNENIERRTRANTKRLDRLVKGHGVKDLVKDMLDDPTFRNKTPAQMKDRMIDWLKGAGLMEDEARKYADKYQNLFEQKMNKARVKAFNRASKGLSTIAPITLDKIRRSLRSGEPDAVRNALAKQAGFTGLTAKDVQRLAQIDQELEQAGPSERAVLLREMANTLQNASGEMSWGQRIYQSFVNSALSGLSTIGLHYTQPAFATATRVGTEFAGIMGDLARGKIKPADMPDKIGNVMKDYIASYKGYVDTLTRSYKNDAYTISFHKSLKDLESLGLDLDNQIKKFKNGNPKEKALALTKMVFASTNITHKMLLSGVEANARSMQNFFTRRGARKLLGETLSDAEIGKLLSEATKFGNSRADDATNSGVDQNRASGIGIDATNQFIRDAVEHHIEGGGKQLSEFAENETRFEIGSRQGEVGHKWDVFNLLTETAKNLANYSRRTNPLFGRMLTGFISVPANLVNRSLSYSPVGLIRAFVKSREIASGKESKLYIESMGNDLQHQQRYLEGVAGTIGMLAAGALFLSQDQDDPNYTGPRITLDGPKDRGLREAWLKLGNRPGSVEWVVNGRVKSAVNYARGGPESLKLPFVAIGALDDMRLNGTLGSDNVVENTGSWLKTMATGGFNQAAFFGLKNISEIPSLANASDKSVASNLTWIASGLVPWSGFVKSLTKLTQGPLDQSSVSSAISAQLPFLSMRGREAVNALGDTKSEVDTSDRIDVYSDRAAHAGLPFYVSMGTPSGDSQKTYAMFLDKGVAPSPPSRASLQQRNGFVDDDTWEEYLKTRGKLIKTELVKDYNYLRDADSATFEKHLRTIEAAATKAAKKKLHLH